MLWPSDQLFCETGHALVPEAVREAFSASVDALRLPGRLETLLAGYYLPFAAWLHRCRLGTTAAPVVGICGAQGSGKSTLCALLSTLLRSAFGARAATVSIDDFYLTRRERERLAARAHPLFSTRGVPGTHDVDLAIRTIGRLGRLQPGELLPTPGFDKAADDRLAKERWPIHRGPIDIILFEGWCVGARAQDDPALRRPVNSLERDEDPDGSWRRAVNAALKTDYQRLFALIDRQVLLQVGDFADVVRFRSLQERKLAASARGGSAVMSDAQIRRFVMHYERLTLHILREMPARADLVIPLDRDQMPTRVTVARPL